MYLTSNDRNLVITEKSLAEGNSFDKLLKLSLNFNTLFGTTIRILYINIILHQNGDFPSVYCDYGNIINKAKKFKSDTSEFVKFLKNSYL
jgi:hypothetical protein